MQNTAIDWSCMESFRLSIVCVCVFVILNSVYAGVSGLYRFDSLDQTYHCLPLWISVCASAKTCDCLFMYICACQILYVWLLLCI